MLCVILIILFILKILLKKHLFGWHDVTVQPAYDGKLLHSNGDNFLYNLRDSYDKLIVLSDYHFKNNYDYIGISKINIV